MQQKSPTCVFHRHETLDTSDDICVCDKITDVLRIIGLRAGGRADTTATTPALLHSPNVLPVGTAISMTASYAEYTPCTRCHTVEGLSVGQLVSFWQHSVLFAAGWIFDTACSSLRRGALVMGVFLIRNTEVEFTVGLITHSTSCNHRLQFAVSQFCDSHTLSKFYAELPLCSAHRATTVRLWWEPRSERVTPHRTMPPMKVILIQDHSQLQAQPDTKQIFGYAAVNIFLCRPAASHLRGTKRKLLEGADMCSPYKVTHQIPAKPHNNPSRAAPVVVAAAAAFASVNQSRGAACTKGHAQPCQGDRRQSTLVFYFDDLSAVEVGEHLVGVEVEVLPSYRAFVPVLYGHLAPFLVVARENA